MKSNPFLLTLAAACSIGLGMLIVGCEDDDDGPAGTSTIQGNVSSFDAGGVSMNFVPSKLKEVQETFLASLVSTLSEVLVPSAYAGGLEGVTVFLKGAVSRSTATGPDGVFIFPDLPAGSYTLRFEYFGDESAWGDSISLQDNQRAELTDVSVSSGNVAIGNIRFVELDPDTLSSTTDPEAAATSDSSSGDAGGGNADDGGGVEPAW